MKTLILVLLLLCPAVFSAQEIEQRAKGLRNSKKFSVEYDKFKDETRVAVGPFSISDSLQNTRGFLSLRMTIRFYHAGRELKQPADDFALLFRSYSREWRFLKNHDLFMLVDGERIAVGNSDYDGDVERNGVSEFMLYSLSPDLIRRLAGAKQVEFKVGRVEIKLNEEHLQAIRDLYSLSK